MSTLSMPTSAERDVLTRRHPVPPLASGDRFSHADYMERYERVSEDTKAERIEGVVYMAAAAVSAGFHGQPHLNMAGWLAVYKALTPGVAAADNTTIVLDVDNDPQPDLCLYIRPTSGGRVTIDDKGYIVGAPELIIEIAASSASYDLGIKQQVFARNGVKEYVVFRTYDGEIDWFVLRDGKYDRVSPDAQGIHRSEGFPGLWLDAPAMIADELAKVLSTLQQGSGGKDHRAFVERLATGGSLRAAE